VKDLEEEKKRKSLKRFSERPGKILDKIITKKKKLISDYFLS
jgi:hypothetical protein